VNPADSRELTGSLFAAVIVVEVDGVRVAQRPQPVDRLGCGEAIAAENVEVLVLERGQSR